ncbi:uncharacterized protein VTP21DRAFT_1026 [Calcarisporiella thermophila]|uniref:uncharacterized protein n=1 Tax=Calcarisporiella thermophila TaxID=911321 RepID=UPI003743D831
MPHKKYRLEVVQQPMRGRMCGFGEKDRRPIDPPPVVQLKLMREDGGFVPNDSIDTSNFVLHAGLWSPSYQHERNFVVNPAAVPVPASPLHPKGPTASVLSLHSPSCTRNLMGSTSVSSHLLLNPAGELGLYFVFQDLSVRTEGEFRLKFSLVDLAPWKLRTDPCRIEAEVFSDVFTVYSAKKFPGMTDSTELSKCFARQGLKLAIREGKRYKRPVDDFYEKGQ